MTQKCVIHNRILESWIAYYEDGRIVELIQKPKYANFPDFGEQYYAIVRKIDDRIGASFVQIEKHTMAFLPFDLPRPKFLFEGSKLIVEVTKRAQSEKLATVKYIGDAKPIIQEPHKIDTGENDKFAHLIAANSQEIGEIESLLRLLESDCIALPNGGNIEFGYTRALTAIDIDSENRQRGGKNQNHFNFTLNQEAAALIGRQIRLRNISGIIIIDFVGTLDPEKSKKLQSILLENIGPQKARISFNFKLGICEIARERIYESLHNIIGNRIENRIIRGAINGIYLLSSSLPHSKGDLMLLYINPAMMKFLDECAFDWRQYIDENIGGRYEIILRDSDEIELRSK